MLNWTVYANIHLQNPIVPGDIFIASVTSTLFGIGYGRQSMFIDRFPTSEDPHNMKPSLIKNGLEVEIEGGGNSYYNPDGVISLPHGNYNYTTIGHGFSTRDSRYSIGNTAKHPIAENRLNRLDLSFVTDYINSDNFYKVASASSDAAYLFMPISREIRKIAIHNQSNQ